MRKSAPRPRRRINQSFRRSTEDRGRPRLGSTASSESWRMQWNGTSGDTREQRTTEPTRGRSGARVHTQGSRVSVADSLREDGSRARRTRPRTLMRLRLPSPPARENGECSLWQSPRREPELRRYGGAWRTTSGVGLAYKKRVRRVHSVLCDVSQTACGWDRLCGNRRHAWRVFHRSSSRRRRQQRETKYPRPSLLM